VDVLVFAARDGGVPSMKALASRQVGQVFGEFCFGSLDILWSYLPVVHVDGGVLGCNGWWRSINTSSATQW
jgi:hypothetical protein